MPKWSVYCVLCAMSTVDNVYHRARVDDRLLLGRHAQEEKCSRQLGVLVLLLLYLARKDTEGNIYNRVFVNLRAKHVIESQILFRKTEKNRHTIPEELISTASEPASHMQ